MAVPATILVAWEALGAAGALPAYLARPSLIGAEVAALVASGEIWTHVGISLYRSLTGLAIGATLGIAAGLLSGVFRPVATFVQPLVSLTNPVPKIALIPVLLTWFGVTDLSKIVLITIGCFYPSFLASYGGVRGVPTIWIWAARNMGAGPARILLRVVLPAALPQILSGLRISTAISFLLMFGSEAIGIAHRAGLGFLVVLAQSGGNYVLMLAAIVTIGALGFTADRLLVAFSRYALRGRTEAVGG